jgi:hypothetical protein
MRRVDFGDGVGLFLVQLDKRALNLSPEESIEGITNIESQNVFIDISF